MAQALQEKIVAARGRAPSASANPQVKRTKSHILQSTRELLVQAGYRSITIDAVSVHSGASRSTIYRHWPSIDELLFDAFAELVGEPFQSPDTGDYKKDLRVINQQYIDSIRDSIWIKLLPSFIELSQNNEHCAKLLELLVQNSRSSSRDILRAAKRSGALSKKANIEWIVDIISGAITYRALLSKKPLEQAGYLDYLINAATAGLDS